MLKLALPLLAIALAPADKVSFDWKPAVGQTAEYKTTNTHKIDMGGGEEDLVITWSSKVVVDKLEGRRVWLKVDNGDTTATIGGETADGVDVRVEDDIEEHELDGRYYKPAGQEGFGFGLYGGFVLPSKPLEAGESYEVEGVKAKYVGPEKVGDWQGHRFSFEARQKSGPWSSGDIWLDAKDLTILRRKIVLHDVDFGHGPTAIANELVRTR